MGTGSTYGLCVRHATVSLLFHTKRRVARLYYLREERRARVGKSTVKVEFIQNTRRTIKGFLFHTLHLTHTTALTIYMTIHGLLKARLLLLCSFQSTLRGVGYTG